MARQLRVVDHIVQQLVDAGVDYMFGVDGANIEDLYDAAYFCDGITAILAKHEFSAATMADGYSRAGCGLGVVMATSGGGSLNLIPGLGESLTSRVPVLALVGQPPMAMDGAGSFQDTSGCNGALDAEALFSAVSVYCRRITDAPAIVPALTEAIAAAKRGGPAVLLLPKDIQRSDLPITPTVAPRRAFEPTGNIDQIAQALRRVDGRVTILAGEQIARDDARDELETVRSLLGASIGTVPDAKDVCSLRADSPAALGVTGIMGNPGVVEIVKKSAICLIVGSRLNATSRAGLDDALAGVPVLSLGSAVPYVPCRHIHSADLRSSLRQLAMTLSAAGYVPTQREGDNDQRQELIPPRYSGSGIRYRDAIDALDAALPDGIDIVVDAGNTGAAAIHNLPARSSGRFVVALGMGGMGYSFGAAIGMTFGRVKSGVTRRTVVVAGDGSFFMHGMEIHTAVQYGLPITFVLFNNNAHAMCVTREQLFYRDLYTYNRFRPSRLGVGLAAMFPGLAAVDVTDPLDLTGALREAIAGEGPSVVSVECSADEVPPFAPFLNQIDSQKDSSSLLRSKEAVVNVAART